MLGSLGVVELAILAALPVGLVVLVVWLFARSGSRSTTAVAGRDVSAQLRELKHLKDDGILTDEEYEGRRAELVDRL